MAYNPYYFKQDTEGKEIAYDLRQGYAKLLTRTLDNIKEYREKRDYKNWFEELDGLFIDISFKLTKPEQTEYNDLLKELNQIISENPSAYVNPQEESNKVYSKLKQINIWLLNRMEEYGIFGYKQYDDEEGL